MMVATSLSWLPEGVLEHVAYLIVAQEDGIKVLSALAATGRRLRDVLTHEGRLRRLVGDADLERAALRRKLAPLIDAETGVLRLTFEGAASVVREDSMPTLRAFAEAARAHRCSLRVDAHTGVHAPPSYASMFTMDRAREVWSVLDLSNPTALVAWGSSVAAANAWQPGVFSARAELSATLDGVHWIPPIADHTFVDAALRDAGTPRRETLDNRLSGASEGEAAARKLVGRFLSLEIAPELVTSEEVDAAFALYSETKAPAAGHFLARCCDAPGLRRIRASLLSATARPCGSFEWQGGRVCTRGVPEDDASMSGDDDDDASMSGSDAPSSAASDAGSGAS